MDQSLNADFHARVLLHTARMDWQPSPAAGVERKRLELYGAPESGRVTSVVRYAAGSRFASHGHPDGEEILVLEGVFEDEHGRYPAGTFLLNPEGFAHAPGSSEGCTLFVKLRQYAGLSHVRVDTGNGAWQACERQGLHRMTLYAAPTAPETIALLRLEPGVEWVAQTPAGGEELFVLEGSMQADNEPVEAGDWLRVPPGVAFRRGTGQGCLLYRKCGHLPAMKGTARGRAAPRP